MPELAKKYIPYIDDLRTVIAASETFLPLNGARSRKL
jgi:hypothetical protein